MTLLSLLIASGLVSGAAYGLIAMGFALIYKSTGVVNFAQGELTMLTAYIAFSLASALDLSFLPLIVVTIPVSMVAGPGARAHLHPSDARRTAVRDRHGDASASRSSCAA